MMINASHIITVLLCLLNIIGTMIWFQVTDLKKFLHKTRQKLDDHTANREVHCDHYKAKVIHGTA
jgi:hypothetical protein